MADYADRIKRLKEKMKEKGIPALLLQKPENTIYLSGFHSSNCSLLFTEKQEYLLTDSRYAEAARDLKWYETLMTSRDTTLYDVIRGMDLSFLGIEEDYATVSHYRKLENCFSGDADRLVRGDGLTEELRAVKDEEELKSIKKAEALGDQCFTHMLSFLQPGMSEKRAAREIERFLLENGAEKLSFDTICVSGPRTSLPHGEPGDRTFEKGDFITMDLGCIIEGYCSDMTRTVALGKASQEQKEIYSIVLSAQMAGCDTIRAGMPCAEADRVVRSVIEDAGYGEFFGHGTGHGVGLEIHECPTLSPSSAEILAPGMVVSIEPGIYLPKKFGVRIEDLAIVTVSGIINTTKSMKELIEL